MSSVPTIRPASADEVLDILCEAFARYPVMSHVLGRHAEDPGRLQLLIRMFVMNRELRQDPILLLEDEGMALAAMTLNLPDSPAGAPGIEELAESTWATLGPAARGRYEAFCEAANAVDVVAPNLHVNMIGVRRAGRGRGLARLLLERAHEQSAGDPVSTGVSLTTESPTNLPFYEHLGYQIVGQAVAADGLRTWGFFRADRPDASSEVETGTRRF